MAIAPCNCYDWTRAIQSEYRPGPLEIEKLRERHAFGFRLFLRLSKQRRSCLDHPARRVGILNYLGTSQ
jgi:hypothetical protein